LNCNARFTPRLGLATPLTYLSCPTQPSRPHSLTHLAVPTQKTVEALALAREHDTEREEALRLLIQRNQTLEASSAQVNRRLEEREMDKAKSHMEAQELTGRLQAELESVRGAAAAAEKANGTCIAG
jgi:hypothetical protein